MHENLRLTSYSLQWTFSRLQNKISMIVWRLAVSSMHIAQKQHKTFQGGCICSWPVSALSFYAWCNRESTTGRTIVVMGFRLHKVNRCLARYSPRATTTNQPTNRATNEPARPGQNDQQCQFWAKFGRYQAKNPDFYWRKQKFWYPHKEETT